MSLLSALKGLFDPARRERVTAPIPTLDGEGRVAVFYFARWCPYSRRFAKAWHAWEAPAGVTKRIVDISDEDSPIWEEHRIRITPSIGIFDDGRMIWRRDGRSNVGLSAKDFARMHERLNG